MRAPSIEQIHACRRLIAGVRGYGGLLDEARADGDQTAIRAYETVLKPDASLAAMEEAAARLEGKGRVWAEIPMAGFFAQGEIGPIGHRNFVHGYTASMAIFAERPASSNRS